MGVEAKDDLATVPGVTNVVPADTHGAATGFEVSSDIGRDVRRYLAAAIVTRGWGLLELRPMRISLEEVFLHLTTEETAEPGHTAEAATAPEARRSSERTRASSSATSKGLVR